MDTIDFAGLRGKGLMHTLSAGAICCAPASQILLRICAACKPDVVLGMGGYVTVPGGMMAEAARRAAGAGECRSGAGCCRTRSLAPLAKRVLFGFRDFRNAPTKAHGDRQSGAQGNPRVPLRPTQRYADRSGPLNVLVVGGSLGAKALNEVRAARWRCIPARTSVRASRTSRASKHIDALRANYAAGRRAGGET